MRNPEAYFVQVLLASILSGRETRLFPPPIIFKKCINFDLIIPGTVLFCYQVIVKSRTISAQAVRLPSGLPLRIFNQEGETIMNTAEIYAKVKAILAEQLNVDEALVSMDTAIRSDLVADESGLVDVLLDLEEAFDLDIPDSDFEDMETVGDIVEYVKNEMD